MEYGEIIDFLNDLKQNDVESDHDNWLSFVSKEHVEIVFPYVHITGTNRKEETGKYLSKILETAKYKIGYLTFESDSMLASISISSRPISEDDFASLFNRYSVAIINTALNYFQIVTLIAIAYFNENNVDVAVIETELGGEEDPTNIPSSIPLLSIITDISIDMTLELGTSLSDIAYQMVGIIKKNSQVLVGEMDESPLDVIRLSSQRKQATLFLVDKFHFETYEVPYYVFDYRPYNKLEILSPSQYLLKSAALAIEAIKILRLRYPLDENAIRKGLLDTNISCRLEKHHQIFIDEAHNVDATKEVAKSILLLANGKNIHILFATTKDKNISSMLPILGRDAAELILTHLDNPYARDDMDYFLYISDYAYQEDWKMALNNLLASNKDDIILITGSRTFAKEAKKYIEEVLHL